MAGSVSTDRRQGVNAGAAFKVPVNVATTANLPLLSGLLTVDGVVLQEGARVLVWKQTNILQNGVYNASTGQWRRAIDFDAEFDLHRGSMIWVVAGSTYANTLFQLTTPDNSPDRGPLPDTNALTFAIVTAATPGDIFSIVQNFFTSSDSSIKIVNNSTNQTINITNNLPAFPDVGGAFYTAVINDNSQIQPTGSYLTLVGGTLTQVVDTPPTSWSSKVMRVLLSSAIASTPCGYRVLTNANSGPVLSSGPGSGGFSFGVLFGTHPSNELTATTSKCIGLSSFTNFSFDPTGGNWTNNANFNTGSAFGMVSNEGDTNWNFFHKASGAAATIVPLGLARLANQFFSFFVRNVTGQTTTLIQIVSLNPVTGAQVTLFNQNVLLNVETNIFLQPFFLASGIAAVTRGIVFQRSFLYVPDGSFLFT